MKARIRVKKFYEYNDGVVYIRPRNKLERDIISAMKETGFYDGIIESTEKNFFHKDVQKTIRKIAVNLECDYDELIEMLNFLVCQYYDMNKDIFNKTFLTPLLTSNDEKSYKECWHTMVFITDAIVCATLENISQIGFSQAVADIERNLLAI
jgi:hypothetical protein